VDADGKKLKRELKRAGFSSEAVQAAWPTWWSDDAAASPSARAELRFTLARRLGLSPKSLSGDRVEFVWRDDARFKHLSAEDDAQKAALASFGITIGRLLLQASNIKGPGLVGIAPELLREAVRERRNFVDLAGLLATCWAVGVPVIHLRVFPLPAKSMHAMVVKGDAGFAILLGRDAEYPAPIAFSLAHEIGHVALGHLFESAALVDLEDPGESLDGDDEELAADRFALSLLTGTADPEIKTNVTRFTARALARAVLEAGPARGIEPGTLALCWAYRTKQWSLATAALRHVYTAPKPVWREVNRVAARELEWEALGDDAATYLRAIMNLDDA
jgi:hypothetical protein